MKERKQMFYEYIYNYVTLNLKPFYYWILMIKIIPKQTIRVFLHCLQSLIRKGTPHISTTRQRKIISFINHIAPHQHLVSSSVTSSCL